MDRKQLDVIAMVIGYIEGDGPMGLWSHFLAWATDEERGYTEDEIESAIAALKKATGRT